MKKLMILAVVALSVASCTTTTKTARTESVPYSMYNATVADLDVAPKRVTFTLKPTKEVAKGGLGNCKAAAIMEALNANGNADLLLEPQFVISHKKGLFRSKVTSVTVTGRPATYKNFRSMNDSVWCDPVFRNTKGVGVEDGSSKGGLLQHIFKK